MSYAEVHPSYWQALQPDGPFEAGAPGWASAPFVGWGHNPDRAIPPMLATDGLGCGCSAKPAAGMGDTALPIWPAVAMYAFLGLVVWGAFKYANKVEHRR